MTFKAYLDNIKSKTGKTPEDFKKLAQKAGVYKLDMKAGELVAWLHDEFGLGRGHSMAIWHYFQMQGWVPQPKSKKKPR